MDTTEVVGAAGLVVTVLTIAIKLLEQRARNPLRREIERLNKENDELFVKLQEAKRKARGGGEDENGIFD